MPNWKIHIILTVACYFLFVLILNPSIQTSIIAIVLLIFSSLLPDLDHPKSKIRGFISGAAFFLVFIFLFSILKIPVNERAIISLVSSGIVYIFFRNLPLKHRGPKSLHQWRLVIIVPILFAALFWYLKINIFLAFFVLFGYGIHLVLDRIKFK